MNNFGNKLITKIDNSVRLFFENVNGLSTNTNYSLNF